MLSFLESFNRLFDQWANEAVQVESFPAKKPRHERIPDAVKAKAAILWEKGICYQDPKPASFRITDAKGVALINGSVIIQATE